MQEAIEERRDAIHPEGNGRVVRNRREHSWLGWAERHAGVILLAAVGMAVLVMPNQTRDPGAERDAEREEVPLFI